MYRPVCVCRANRHSRAYESVRADRARIRRAGGRLAGRCGRASGVLVLMRFTINDRKPLDTENYH
jgi:hypothetical protein